MNRLLLYCLAYRFRIIFFTKWQMTSHHFDKYLSKLNVSDIFIQKEHDWRIADAIGAYLMATTFNFFSSSKHKQCSQTFIQAWLVHFVAFNSSKTKNYWNFLNSFAFFMISIRVFSYFTRPERKINESFVPISNWFYSTDKNWSKKMKEMNRKKMLIEFHVSPNCDISLLHGMLTFMW